MRYRSLTLGIAYSATLVSVPASIALGVVEQPSPPKCSNYFKPLCDLLALNSEYAATLGFKRRQASPMASTVRFDGNMLPGTVFHNQRMFENDSLYHDYLSFHAELVGYLNDAEEFRDNPKKLARYIWSRFDKSAHHAAIQRQSSLCYVSVSCSSHYFVVRLDDHPTPRDKAEQKRFQLWQARSSAVAN